MRINKLAVIEKYIMEVNFNIFISHDSSDETVAIELKNFLENIFLNASVYVSGRDLQGGQTWIENIKLSLKTSQVIISLITKNSIENNWIFFETGAGFTEDKSIPLLADGLKFNDLYPPLSLLQARTLSKTGIESLVNDISSKLYLRSPKNLTGLNKLLSESDKFFKLRNSESTYTAKEVKIAKTKTKITPEKNQDNGYDLELRQLYDQTVQRTGDLIKRKILSYNAKLDVPTEEELNELPFNKLKGVADAYNLKTPSVVATLLVTDLSFPKSNAKNWEKMNARKFINDAIQKLDKYEKTI